MNRPTSSNTLAIALSLLVLLANGAALGATLGDPKLGEAYARAHCAACHAITPDKELSPVLEATPFEEVANTRGINRRALIVFLRSPHPTMPNLVVQGDDADNLIAYILSLKSK